MLKTPEKISTLQRKLYRKAKQEPVFRFHALYDKVYRADILSHAYALVRANKGSAGIDGETFMAIEEREGGAALIAELEDALRNKTYKPDPVKRVMIPKTIKDRVTQLTRRVTTVKPLERIVWEVNTTVRGWVNYFHYRNCSKTMTKVRGHVEARLQTHLRKRHKVRDRGTGYARFSSRALYEKYGLYKVPTTAAWTKAHALR